MDQHPIPRQITTFEFKLVGFLTIKQFIYLLVFTVLGVIVYALTPIPLLNYLFGFLTGGVGLAFAFVPINDRPMEVWIKNLIKRLTSPTQYTFKKENKPPAVLINAVSSAPPKIVATHLDSQQKLKNYLSSSKANQAPQDNKKQSINSLLNNPLSSLLPKKGTTTPPPTPTTSPLQSPTEKKLIQENQPFLTGVVKNHKNIPLGGILIYIKNPQDNKPLRILKTNIHGVFLSYHPLPAGEYLFEIKDPKQSYFFDTIKISLKNQGNQPLEIFSKELL